jgi:flagellar hook protein FlgE
MYAAVSGLKAHMNKLNVISNNVSNVNTYGYKSARAVFKESLYSTMRGGSNGTNVVGGVNPAQYGYGCNVGTIDLDMSTKNYVPTGNALDVMINGTGFFMVGNKAPMTTEDGDPTGQLTPTFPQDLYLTRVGNFVFDSQGYLVDGYGNCVYGYVTVAGVSDDDGVVTPSNAPGFIDPTDQATKDNPPVSTQLVPIRLPLAMTEAAAEDNDVPAGTAVYPGLVDDEDSSARYNYYEIPGDTDNLYTDGSKTIAVNVDSITIDGQTGKITATNNADDSIIVIGYIPLASVTNPNGVTHSQGPYYRAGPGSGLCAAASVGGAMDGKFVNNIEDPEDPDAIAIVSMGATQLITAGLESSGTDIATEFSEMITTQRGYQANTRIITVTDSMLEELVNMKRG